MPSFVCDECQSTLKKAKLDAHLGSCGTRSFSCIDCGVSFRGTLYRSHSQCITEAEKYEKKVVPSRLMNEKSSDLASLGKRNLVDSKDSKAEKVKNVEKMENAKTEKAQHSHADQSQDSNELWKLEAKKALSSCKSMSLYKISKAISKSAKKQMLRSISLACGKNGEIEFATTYNNTK